MSTIYNYGENKMDSTLLEAIKALGIAGGPVFAFLWWLERKERLECQKLAKDLLIQSLTVTSQGYSFGYHRYFSYYRIEERNEGEFQIFGTAYKVNSKDLEVMWPWIRSLIPERIRKEDGFASIEYEATHLTSAMGSLDLEVSLMQKDRQRMSNLLEGVVRSVGKKTPNT